MYCPKCKTEYREGFTTCSECGTHLVEKLSDVEEGIIVRNWARLTDTKDELEFNLLTSVLESEGIPTQKQYNGAGEYLKVMWGFTNLGIEIKVPKELLDKSKKIISEYNSAKIIDEDEPIEKNDNDVKDKEPTKIGKALGWLVIAIFCVAVAYAISEAIIAIIHAMTGK